MILGWTNALSGVPNANKPRFVNSCTSQFEIDVKLGAVEGTDNSRFILNPDNKGGSIVLEPGLATDLTNADLAAAVFNHESGHLLGLNDAGSGSGCTQMDTVMFRPVNLGSLFPCGPAKCDKTATLQNYPPSPRPPPDTDGDEPAPGPGGNSPILLPVGQSAAYPLTGTDEGVWFDIDADGSSERVGWPAAGEPLGFLALDRNRNGVIDSGRELFGNYTPIEGDQTGANGFEALAHWDRPEAGGNGDGWIDNQDAVWGELLVWIDGNHDGFTQLGELFHPSIFYISAISLDYRVEGRRDQFGNFYRLKAEFLISQKRRWAYDVFLATQQ